MTSRENLEKLKRSLQNQLVGEFAPSYFFEAQGLTDKKKTLAGRIRDLIEQHARTKKITPLEPKEKDVLVKEMVDEMLGFGPIDDLMDDDSITEIMINGPNTVYAEKAGQKALTKIRFRNIQELNRLIHKLVSYARRKVDETTPYVDVYLEGGTRVNIIIPPLSLEGPAVTIRKHSKNIVRIEDLIRLGTLSNEAGELLVASVRAKINLIFSGPTGVGKTTTLKVLTYYISPDERIVVIEDTAELSFHQNHVVRLQAKLPNIEGRGGVTIRDLLKNSLRMRPDRIVIGEVRGGEALDMLQAMASGHSGAMGVIHAASPQDVASRLETMIATSGITVPLWAIRKHIANSLNLIIQQERLLDGSRKITHITEVRGVKKDEIVLEDIFTFVQKGINKDGSILGEMKPTGRVPLFLSQLEKKGIKLDKKIFSKEA